MNPNSINKLGDMLAKKLNELKNPPSTEIRVCEVINATPLRLKWGDILIYSDTLVIPRKFKEGHTISYQYMDTNGNMVDHETVVKIELNIGDKVTAAPDQNLQNWYLLDLL